ncbi:hypothetical protein MNBD_NITROSPINAE04-2169 [hydrothermal vent metagenome]|uniref:CobW/HypB/UreG nucleotide-binding domain-containing protein n=1 Tax=hydrothermal vent metagenome TaxID=652676 RepID=A0A3B1BNP9_9ZZZZ
MKLVQIAGYLGSGKTTLILALVRIIAGKGQKVAILVNDIGEVPVDGKIMEEFGLTVKDIGGGCICCQVAGNMRSTLKTLAREIDPDMVIIEPTGMAVPGAVKEVAGYVGSTVDISFGPTIVLFDTTRAEKLLTYETLERLVTTQLKDADIIALSKVDAIENAEVDSARKAVSKFNSGAEIIRLSTKSGEGLDDLAEAALNVTISA